MILLLVWSAGAATAADTVRVYFGTYTGGTSQGIYTSILDRESGQLSPPELAGAQQNPAFLALHPNGKYLYAVGEGGKESGVNAFAIDATTGRLTFLNRAPSGGDGPTHLVVDRSGRYVLVANYGGGSVASMPIRPDGTVGPPVAFVQHTGSSVNSQRQKEPHAHGIYVDSQNRFAFVPDLGLDKVLVYRFDPASGALTAHEPTAASVVPGSGPRHFAFSPDGLFGYVINEMLCTMTAFSYDPTAGRLTTMQTISTLPAGVSVQPGYSTAEVFVHPSGRFLYGSNRGHDTIVVYAIDARTGLLKPVEHEPTLAKIPRGFGIDPSGRYLIVGGQSSNEAVVFRVNVQTGALSPTGSRISLGAPVCVEFWTPPTKP